MVCDDVRPIYSPRSNGGANLAESLKDGYSIAVYWDQAFPSVFAYSVAYNIYYSTLREDVLTEGVKFVSHDGYLNACVLDLTPGDTYYFTVKATQHDPAWFNLALLPEGYPGLKIYPEGMLLTDISATDLTIMVSDVDQFPAYGIVVVGTELIRYTSKDIPTSSLIVSERGFLSTNIRIHNTDGYDGIAVRDPLVKFWTGLEDSNLIIQQETASFGYTSTPDGQFTTADGFSIKNDIISTDLNASDTGTADFPRFDFVGWHRTTPDQLLNGACIGSYYGGERFCADGYGGIHRQIRGVPLNDIIHAREEVLLETFGQPCVFVRRMWEGIRCSCVTSTREIPEHRCPSCLGTGFYVGYSQFFNPRRSDGRIMVRFGPTIEDIKSMETGLENEFIPDCWTSVYPAIKDRDFLIRFNQDGTEEFRYEILNVTRNIISNGESGAQKFIATRVRKTDPIYMFRSIRDTSTMPVTLATTIGLMAGPNNTFLPHSHNIVINEGIVSLSQINQTTSIAEGHNHPIVDGVIQEMLSHTHSIILP